MIELRKKKADGRIVRSRAKWIYDYEGEQNSTYFRNFDSVQKAMCFIQKDDGDIIHDSKFPRKLRPFMRICMHHVRITLYIVILII